MYYKIGSIVQYSFLAVSLSVLLSSTSLAQDNLSLTEDNAPVVEENTPETDEFDFSLSDDELSPKTEEQSVVNEGENPSQELNMETNDNIGLPSNSMEAPENNPSFPEQPAFPEQSDNNNFNGLELGNVGFPQNDAPNNIDNNFFDDSNNQAMTPTVSANFGDDIMDQVKEDLFSQMADIEKQTSLLTLELKREKIKNEIEAMRNLRQKAIEDEKDKAAERERKQAEWEQEQERKLLQEQQKLKALDIKYEKLRQERVLKAYKEDMLRSSQDWVDYSTRLYNQLIKEEETENELIQKQKQRIVDLNNAIAQANSLVATVKETYVREVSNLKTQVAILKSKLEAEKNAFEESKNTGPNPFAMVEDENVPVKKLSEEYAIMEISGKGDLLVAKLINKSGGTFMVKKGTILNTGHVVEDITQTYISADKGGAKEYLYFSAGGILDKEPEKPIETPELPANTDNSTPQNNSALQFSDKIPGLRSGMFVK